MGRQQTGVLSVLSEHIGSELNKEQDAHGNRDSDLGLLQNSVEMLALAVDMIYCKSREASEPGWLGSLIQARRGVA